MNAYQTVVGQIICKNLGAARLPGGVRSLHRSLAGRDRDRQLLLLLSAERTNESERDDQERRREGEKGSNIYNKSFFLKVK